jgi:hypothetical protein
MRHLERERCANDAGCKNRPFVRGFGRDLHANGMAPKPIASAAFGPFLQANVFESKPRVMFRPFVRAPPLGVRTTNDGPNDEPTHGQPDRPRPGARRGGEKRPTRKGCRNLGQLQSRSTPRRRMARDAMSRHSAHDRRWQRLRAAKRRANPKCDWPGCSKPPTTVEHVVPQIEGPDLRFEWARPLGSWPPKCSRDLAFAVDNGSARFADDFERIQALNLYHAPHPCTPLEC